MTQKQYIQIIILIIIFSITGYYISKLTYDNIDARVQSKVSFESDYFIIGEFNHTFYNFNQSINKLVDSIRNASEGNSDICKIPTIDNIRPISLNYDGSTGIFQIEIINNNTDENEKCFNNILNLTTIDFHNYVKNAIDKKNFEIEEFSSNFLKEKDISYKNFKQIDFSDFLNLLNLNEINKIGLGKEYFVGKLENNTNFYTTVDNLSSKDFILNKLVEKNVKFYFLDEDSVTNAIHSKIYYETQFSRTLDITLLKKKLEGIPYKVLKTEHINNKISYKVYMLLLIICFNILTIIIFFSMNTYLLRKLVNFVKTV